MWYVLVAKKPRGGNKMAKRQNGEGCVRKRSDGRWEGIFLTDEVKNGKRVRKSVTAKTKSECQEKLAKAIQNNSEAQQVLTRCAFLTESDPTLKEWSEIWLDAYCRASKKEYTRRGYENYFQIYILPRIGKLKLKQISTTTCQKLLIDLFENGRMRSRETRGNGLAAKTVKDIKITLQACLQKAVDEGLIQTNPVCKVDLPKEPKKEMQTLKPNEIGRFLNEAKDSQCYEFYLLELTTGLRLGEILALTWDDFNEEEKTITVNKQVQRIGKELVINTPKTEASNRTIRLCDDCVTNLILLRSRQGMISPKRLMFPSPTTLEERDPASVTRMLHRIQKRAGLPQIRFHDLRHSFATLSLGEGQDIKTISAMLGHTDAGFTMNTYMHVTHEMQDNVANAVGDLIKEQEKHPYSNVVSFSA